MRAFDGVAVSVPCDPDARRGTVEGSPTLWTLQETAASLRVSQRTLRRQVAARRIRCVRIGRRLLFDPADVSRFVAARKE
jgi:excisionase family DNA binding protein